MQSDAIVVAPTAGERVLIWVGFPLVGASVGWLLKALAGWVAALPWAPFQGPLRLVDSVSEPYATLGSLGIGLVAGLALAVLAERDYVRVTVGHDQVTIAREGSSRSLPRESISVMFFDGKQLVLLGGATEELVRQGGDLDVKRLPPAFRAHGYPWLADGDPHRGEYRRWVPDTPRPACRGQHNLRGARACARQAR
jgi:hypothetical protein